MKKTSKIIAIILVALMLILCISTNASANYQCNGSAGVPNSATTWINNIRNMEAEGQVMGLTEEHNDDLTPTTSNNIDVHMIKNTEWGAIAILSASQDYGKIGSGTARYVLNGDNLATTTGNTYGIYMYDWHNNWTASEFGDKSRGMSNAENRYINLYSANNYVGKDGDAMWYNWHNVQAATWNWFNNSGNWRGWLRGYRSIFAYAGTQQTNSGAYESRACIVCGQGY